MGIFYQPPQVPAPARSIVPELYPKIVYNPPFGQLRSSQALAINAAWIPPDPQPSQGLRSIVPKLYPKVVDNPPFLCAARDPDYFWNIVRLWDPPDPQPAQGFRSALPAIYPVIVSNPPFAHPGRPGPEFSAIIASWADMAPQPQRQVSVIVLPDNPPFTMRNPLWQILRTWDPPDPTPWQLVESAVPAKYPVIVNNPPFGYRGDPFYRLVDAWAPGIPQPPRPDSRAATPGWSVDNPTGWKPFQWQANPFWQIQDSGPQQLRILCPGAYAIIIPAYNPVGAIGASFYAIMSSWLPDPAPMQGRRSILPAICPFAVSNPPFSARALPAYLFSLSQDIDFAPFKRAILPQIPPAFVPFSRFGRPEIWSIIKAWEAWPGQPGKIILPVIPGCSKIFIADAKGLIYVAEPEILVVKSMAEALDFIAEAKQMVAKPGFKLLTFKATKEYGNG